MTARKFFPNRNVANPALPTRELWRMSAGPGHVIVYETMEEVFFEARTAPYDDRREILPILRAILEVDTMVQVGPLKRCAVVLEGLTKQGGVFETHELTIDDTDEFAGNYGKSVGHRFAPLVKTVRVSGWWIEPKPSR